MRIKFECPYCHSRVSIPICRDELNEKDNLKVTCSVCQHTFDVSVMMHFINDLTSSLEHAFDLTTSLDPRETNDNLRVEEHQAQH